jgi:hypothetical protein
MGFGPPGRYEASLIGFAIGVDHCDLNAVYKSDSVNPHFAILEPIIGPFDRRSVENPRRILKSDSMPTGVG